MRDQYVGDVSDLLKYALLRVLACDDRRLGVAWYYNPDPDGRNDGRHTECLREEKWRALDDQLWSTMRDLPARAVAAVEQLSIWPSGVNFHRVPMPNWRSRSDWAAGMAQSLGDADLVFLDPDNGLGRRSRRHATLEEVKLLRHSGERALLLIKFPGRTSFEEQEKSYADDIHRATGARRILTLQTSVAVPVSSGGIVPRFRWFTLVDHDDVLANRLADFAHKLSSIPGAKAVVCPEQCRL